MGDKLVFKKIQEDRGEYYVEYQPPTHENRFAILHLTFPGAIALEKIVEFVERESELWIKRYPVPIMTFAFDITGSIIEISKIRNSSSLVTWLENDDSGIATSWTGNDLDDFLEKNSENPDWRAIYPDIPYRTNKEVMASALEDINLRRKQIITLKIIFILGVFVTVSWATIVYLNPEWLRPLLDWMGLLSFLFVLYMAAKKTLRLLGYLKPSVSDSKKMEEERQKMHHHYHCKINPMGFARLKAENFDNEMRVKTLEEAKKLKGTKN